jgi:hypothetical protein
MSNKLDTVLVWTIGLLFFVALVLYSNSPVLGEEWQFEVVQPQREVKVSEFYVVMFSADYCGVCQIDKRDVLPQLQEVMPLSGIVDVVADPSPTRRHYFNFRGKDQYHEGVRLLPTYWLVERKRNGKRVIIEEWVGRTNKKTILDKFYGITSNTQSAKPNVVVSVPVKPKRTPSVYNGIPGNSHTNRDSLVDHLLNDGIHRGRWSFGVLATMSDEELNEAHNNDHN